MTPIFHMIPGAPDPVAPFSHAVEADGWVFVTGQMPFESTSIAAPYPEGIEAQTHQVMKQRRLLGFAKLLFRELAGTRKIALLKGRDYGGDGCLVMHAFVPKPDACN